MDECIIYSDFSESQDHYDFTTPNGKPFKVCKRPYLDTFLGQISQKYELHIFTAAHQIYAEPILDMLDPYVSHKSTRKFFKKAKLEH